MKKRGKKIAIALVGLLIVLAGVGVWWYRSSQGIIWRVERVDEYNRTEEQWIQLIRAYEKLGEREKAREAVNAGSSRLQNSAALAQYANKYLYSTPEPSLKPGEYEEAIELVFDGQGSCQGQLYVLVDQDLTPEKAVAQGLETDILEGILVAEYPSEEDFVFPLALVGKHRVQAFVSYGWNVVTPVFEGTYTLGKNSEVKDLAIRQEEGEYDTLLEVEFVNNEDRLVHYTTDGTDPLGEGSDGEITLHGKSANNEKVMLYPGTTTITARCVGSSGLVSPLIQKTFTVFPAFDSTSSRVGEAGQYEFVSGEQGLWRYDKETGKKEQLFRGSTGALLVNTYKTTRGEALGELGDNVRQASAEMALKMEEEVQVIQVLAESLGGMAYHLLLEEDRVLREEEVISGDIPQTLAWNWIKTEKTAIWDSDKPEVGTQEVARWATMLTQKYALYRKLGELTISNPDGSGERLLWTAEESPAYYIHALYGDDLFYETREGVHMIYNIAADEHRENRMVPKKASIVGYTTSAVFYQEAGSQEIQRVEIDYNAL